MIHPTSDIKTNKIGKGTNIWQFCVILERASIGCECNINAHVFIENDVFIGDRVTIKAGVQLWDGLRLEDDVFIGPNVTFTNDQNPRSKQYPDKFLQIFVKQFASVGAGATILPGIIIGRYSLVGAGAVVTRNVPNRALVVGNPAKIVAWLNDDGSKMIKVDGGWRDSSGQLWKELNNKISRHD